MARVGLGKLHIRIAASMMLLCAASGAAAPEARRNLSSRGGEVRALAAVEEALDGRGIDWTSRDLGPSVGGFGTSVIVSSRNEGAASGTIVFAAPLAGSVDESGRLSFGARALVELAAMMVDENAPVRSLVAFLGDEPSSLPEDLRGPYLLGLRDLVGDLASPERSVVIYLDLPGEDAAVSIQHGARGTLAPLELLRPLATDLAAALPGTALGFPYNELFRLGLVEGPAPLEYLGKLGIPALLLGRADGDGLFPAPGSVVPSEGATVPTEVVPADRALAEGLYAYGARFRGGFPQEADRHYTVIQLWGRRYYITEGAAVWLFLSVAALAAAYWMIYTLIHRSRLRERWRHFFSRIWILPAGFALLFGGLRAGRWLVIGALAVVGDGGAWAAAPYGAAGLKILMAVSTLALLRQLFARTFRSTGQHFYGSAALVCMVLGIMASAILDLTFMPHFLWAFVFALVSAASSSVPVATAATLLSPLRLLATSAAAALSGDTQPAILAFAGGLRADLFMALTILPFALLALRITLLRRPRGDDSPGRQPGAGDDAGSGDPEGTAGQGHRFPWAGVSFLAAAIAACFAYALLGPGARKNVPALVVRERQVGATGSVSALAAYGKRQAGLRSIAGAPVPLPDDYAAGASPTGVPAEPLSLGVSAKRFLDRIELSIVVGAQGSPALIDLSVISDAPFSVHDCSYPVTRNPDDLAAALSLGERPEGPVKASIVLPAGPAYRVVARGIWTEPFVPLETDPPASLDYALVAETSVEASR